MLTEEKIVSLHESINNYIEIIREENTRMLPEFIKTLCKIRYNLNYCIENGFKDKEEILKQVISEWVECCAFSAQGPMNFVLYNRDQEKMEEINKNLYKEVNKFNKNLEKIFK